jgi:hypothetical protein
MKRALAASHAVLDVYSLATEGGGRREFSGAYDDPQEGAGIDETPHAFSPSKA